MSKKAAPAAPEREGKLFAALVGSTPGAELKGAALPYSAVNGNMHAFLDKAGIAETKVAAGWLRKSRAYAQTLKPKATMRKKRAA